MAKVENRHREAARAFMLRFASKDRGPIDSFGTRCTAQALADQEAEMAAWLEQQDDNKCLDCFCLSSAADSVRDGDWKDEK